MVLLSHQGGHYNSAEGKKWLGIENGTRTTVLRSLLL